MKGFISVTTYGKAITLATNAIVSIARRDNGTCIITPLAPVIITSAHPTVLTEQSYEEVLSLLREAQ